jgi:LDH2 family malate/lactate/ureidoglycolate dehydrogenase
MAEAVRAAAVVPWERCVEFATRAYEAAGMSHEHALDAATAIVDADGHGTVTHGLKNLRGYITDLTSGRINPTPNMRVVGGPKAAAIIDADNAQGHVAASFGMRTAIELAEKYSVGNAFVRSSNHYGHSGYWASMAVRKNMVGFAITNSSAGIAPFGGKVGLIGNNPPSWAIPTRVVDPNVNLPAAEYQPVFLDMALSVVAANRLDIYRRRGEPLPPGWALDKDGEPTDDAIARSHGGTITAVAGYKGAGLAVVLSMITSFLGGSPPDTDRLQPDGKRTPATTGHWFQAYDIGQFTDLEAFTKDARETRERLQASPPKAGFERVYAPGDLENAKAIEHYKNGVPLEQFTLDDLEWVASHVGIAYDLVR